MILALDIGGTSVKIALVKENGEIVKKGETSTSFDNYQTPIIDTVIAFAKDFSRDEKLSAVGVSATGQVDSRLGKIIGSNGKIAYWEGTEIKRLMEESFSVPCYVMNDANAAALGEATFGAAKGAKDAIMVTIGTGVGGGIIIDGKLYGGALGLAGEIGHFTLRADGVPCSCKKTGCFESYASTTALVERAIEKTGDKNLNGRIIFERAHKNDELMLAILDEWMDDIAQGISGLVHIFNPEMILIGGGVSAQYDLFIKPLEGKIKAVCMPAFGKCLTVKGASLGNDAGLFGAVSACLNN